MMVDETNALADHFDPFPCTIAADERETAACALCVPARCATPLTIALERNRLDLLAVLLRHGADANLCIGDSACPIFHAANKKQNALGFVLHLLAAGADPTAAERANLAFPGGPDVARLLLVAGVKAEAAPGWRDFDERPLNCYPETALLLVANGADVTSQPEDHTRSWDLRLADRDVWHLVGCCRRLLTRVRAGDLHPEVVRLRELLEPWRLTGAVRGELLEQLTLASPRYARAQLLEKLLVRVMPRACHGEIMRFIVDLATARMFNPKRQPDWDANPPEEDDARSDDDDDVSSDSDMD